MNYNKLVTAAWFSSLPFPNSRFICHCLAFLHHPRRVCVCAWVWVCVCVSFSWYFTELQDCACSWWRWHEVSEKNVKVVSNLVPRDMILKSCFHLDISSIFMLFAFCTKYLHNFYLKSKNGKGKPLQYICGCGQYLWPLFKLQTQWEIQFLHFNPQTSRVSIQFIISLRKGVNFDIGLLCL